MNNISERKFTQYVRSARSLHNLICDFANVTGVGETAFDEYVDRMVDMLGDLTGYGWDDDEHFPDTGSVIWEAVTQSFPIPIMDEDEEIGTLDDISEVYTYIQQYVGKHMEYNDLQS